VVADKTTMPRTTEEHWNRLQREYQSAVSAEYPNPQRKGCPGSEVLRRLAEHSVRPEDLRKDPHWKHAIQCGPCYREYIALSENFSSPRMQAPPDLNDKV
jgi:hypothetical protein